jgi:hypothetical protein
LLFVALSIGLFVAFGEACGGTKPNSAATPDAGSDAQPAVPAAAAFAREMCADMQGCNPNMVTLLFGTEDACIATLAAGSSDAGVSSPSCKSFLGTATCSEIVRGQSATDPQPCGPIAFAQTGDTCAADGQCTSSFCQKSGSDPSFGTCAAGAPPARSPLGGVCTSHDDCAWGQQCSGGVCAALGTVGRPCSATKACDSVLLVYCDPAPDTIQQCRSLYVSRPAGECGSNGAICPLGYSCQASAADAGTATCTPAQGQPTDASAGKGWRPPPAVQYGGACSDASYAACIAELAVVAVADEALCKTLSGLLGALCWAKSTVGLGGLLGEAQKCIDDNLCDDDLSCVQGMCTCAPPSMPCGSGADSWCCQSGTTCGDPTSGSVCTCPSPLTDCSGLPGHFPDCKDLTSDSKNCGSCGTQCPANSTCMASNCVCNAPLTKCFDSCVDLQTDDFNCGGCGNVCPSSESCTNGACGCPQGQTLCNGQCVDTSSDASNCGGCGSACRGGQQCVAGSCSTTTRATGACEIIQGGMVTGCIEGVLAGGTFSSNAPVTCPPGSQGVSIVNLPNGCPAAALNGCCVEILNGAGGTATCYYGLPADATPVLAAKCSGTVGGNPNNVLTWTNTLPP